VTTWASANTRKSNVFKQATALTPCLVMEHRAGLKQPWRNAMRHRPTRHLLRLSLGETLPIRPVFVSDFASLTKKGERCEPHNERSRDTE
jgi:hypothetical protein